MRRETNQFLGATKAFNTIRITKGQATSIATCDMDGNPNVAPIGSMRIVDQNTVHVLQGFLARTLSNLKSNPKATFSVCVPPSFRDIFTLFKKNEEGPLGYQVYCELTEMDESKEAVEREYRQLVNRAPRLLRGLFLKFCERNLKRLLRFKILEIREIGSPG